jgi:ubiquinone/menaquinone biosynthesis C-methylase UbiE
MDDPSLILVGGDPLTPDAARALPPGAVVRLMVYRPAVRPIDAGDIVEVNPGAERHLGDVVLCIHAGRCALGRVIRDERDSSAELQIGPGGARHVVARDAVVGVVTALEQGDLLFDLRHGRWRAAGRLAARVPGSLTAFLVALSWLERVRRPFFPPLFMGTEARLLAGVTAAYDTEVEVTARETALLNEEHVLLERYLRRGQRLLDVGCGAGREAVGFARAGLSVVAIDLAPAMIARARERARAAGVTIDLAVAEPLTLPASAGPFDAVYFSPGIYAHIPGRDRRVRTLRRLRELLTPGGLIVVGPVLSPPLRLFSRARLVDALRRIGHRAGYHRLAEPGDRFYRGHALTRGATSYRYIHYFASRDEAEAEVPDTGLVVAERLDTTCWILRARA